jgi:hypothetical protein
MLDKLERIVTGTMQLSLAVVIACGAAAVLNVTVRFICG